MERMLFEIFFIFMCMISAYVLVSMYNIFTKKGISTRKKLFLFFSEINIRKFIYLLEDKYYINNAEGSFSFKKNLVLNIAEILVVTGSVIITQDYEFSNKRNVSTLKIQQNFNSDIKQLKKIGDSEKCNYKF